MTDSDSAIRNNPVRNNYDELADEYDRRWSTYIERSLEETLARLEVEAGTDLLDVGCGTGIFLKRLLETESDLEVTGVDLSPEMLEVARGRLSKDVGLFEADATELPFEDESFDQVVSTSAFHYIDQPQRALAEFYRVLKPSGRLVLTDWCTDFLTTRLLTLVLRWSDEAHYRAYGVDEMVGRLSRAGFEEIKSERYKIQWQWGLMTLRARV